MILKDPDDFLHLKCEPVTLKEGKRIGVQLKKEYDQATKEAKDMVVVGLAAPQILIPKRVFVCFGRVFINPSIRRRDGSEVISEEGCLSLPSDEICHPARSSEILAQWVTESGTVHVEWLRSVDAIVFQHELDHLNGKLCNE